MTDLQLVLPDLDARLFSHLLPSLDKALVTTADLLTVDVAALAKRAQLPAPELRKLVDAIVPALHSDVGLNGQNDARSGNVNEVEKEKDEEKQDNTTTTTWPCISTLDETLDSALGGGLPTGYLTEITGESGAGKTQFLLTLLLASQLPPPLGLGRPAIYISTEAVLSTTRLSQLLNTHPILSTLPASQKPSLSRILSIQTPDLESQDHILRYQLPVAIKKHSAGLVILDSVAANYRAEFDAPGGNGAESMATRSAQLIQLGALLRSLARTENIAVVVANQVADRFERAPASTAASRTASGNSQASVRTPTVDEYTPSASNTTTTTNAAPGARAEMLVSPDPLALDHQQRWFTGWGDDPRSSHPKTPSLGLVWTNQLACRVALVKKPVFAKRGNLLANIINNNGAVGGGNGNPGAGTGIGGVSGESKDGTANAEDGDRDHGDNDGSTDTYITKWRRWARVVFAPWVAPSEGRGIEFEIVMGGIRAVGTEPKAE